MSFFRVGLACAAMAAAQAPGPAAAQPSGGAAALRASYAAMAEPLKHNQFGRPLVLDSAESPDSLKGDIYAVVEHPFATVNAALNEPGEWCDVLILHINTKYCGTSRKPSGTVITVAVGKKHSQPLADAYRVEFAWQPVASAQDYLEIRLDAPTGPLGTSDYRILLQAVPVDGNRTFLHLRYSYGYGFAGRMAMKTYLATIGSDKVGFTASGKGDGGQAGYVRGVRGVVERNTMRYYLAIDAYLDALAAAPSARLERRLEGWFSSTERFARQLREMERDEYLRMKREEYRRLQQPW